MDGRGHVKLQILFVVTLIHPLLLVPYSHQEGWPGEEREGPLVLPGEGRVVSDRGGWAGGKAPLGGAAC